MASSIVTSKASLSLRVVCNELSTVSHKLYKIGIQLGIPRYKLEEFKKKDDPLSAAIDYWLNGNVEGVEVSWTSIVSALESGQVDEKGLAKKISDKYCKGVPMSLNTLTLLKWKDEQGENKSFRLVNLVSDKWRKIGTRLDIDPNVLDGWARQHLHDASRCWEEVVHNWITKGGTHDYPAKWEGMYLLLDDIECEGIAQALKKAVDNAII